MVQGTGSSIGQRLVSNPKVNAVLFSGTYKHACDVQQALLGRPEVPLFLNTGGKSAAIVLASCDIQQAAFECLAGASKHAGQLPNSTARVFVEANVHDKFMHALTTQIHNLKVGPSSEPSTQMGPLISQISQAAYLSFAKVIEQAGHEITVPPKPVDILENIGHFVTPAVYTIDWENGDGLLVQIPPGPSLLIYKVSTASEAVSLYNQLRYRPCVALYIDSTQTALNTLTSTIKTGSVNVNRGTTSRSMRLPATPHGHSSNGLSSGLNLLAALSIPRAYVVEAQPK